MTSPILEEVTVFPASAIAERRREAREQRALQGWLSESADERGADDAKQQLVSVTNLSVNGVGFRATRHMEVGSAHWMVIATDRLHLSTRLRIISVRPLTDGTCDVGGEFF